jgi:hypothetical protein
MHKPLVFALPKAVVAQIQALNAEAQQAVAPETLGQGFATYRTSHRHADTENANQKHL